MGEEARPRPEKFYYGNSGTPLYYGRKFQEHTRVRPCPECQVLNPISFHYCYRCGARILPAEEGGGEESA